MSRGSLGARPSFSIFWGSGSETSYRATTDQLLQYDDTALFWRAITYCHHPGSPPPLALALLDPSGWGLGTRSTRARHWTGMKNGMEQWTYTVAATPFSDRDIMIPDKKRMMATLDFLLQPLRWNKNPGNIVASSTSKNSSNTSCVQPPFHSIFHSIVPFHIPVQW